jgi:hypothetical protein
MLAASNSRFSTCSTAADQRLDRDALSIAEVQNILMAYVIVLNRATGAPASARRAPARNR